MPFVPNSLIPNTYISLLFGYDIFCILRFIAMPTTSPTPTVSQRKERIIAAADLRFAKGFKEKDKTVIDLFYNQYAAALYGMIKKALLQDKISDDTLAHIFQQMLHCIASYDPNKESFFIWSYRIAHKEVSKQRVNMLLRHLFSC